MRIVKQVAHFEATDNPTADQLLSLNPDLVIPANYSGKNTNSDLAQLFVDTIASTGATVAELAHNKVAVGDMKKNLFSLFVANATRFGIKDAASTFYTLQEILDLTSDEKFFYLLNFAAYYKGEMVSMAPTLRQIYSFPQWEDAADDRGLIPLATVDHFLKLSETLREEGIILPSKDLFICATRWGDKEVLDLLFRGLDLEEAVKMYEIGFTTIEEIVEYYGNVPSSWMDKMLG